MLGIKMFKAVPKLLLVEDDPDQMDLLLQFVLDEIRALSKNPNISDEKKEMLSAIKILKANNIESLRIAVSRYKDIFLAVLDCNLPDNKTSSPNDQLVKTSHRITGQHYGVDILNDNLPSVPITLISSKYRFKKIVYEYYESQYGLNITFIKKSDQDTIQRNIGYHLRRLISEQG